MHQASPLYVGMDGHHASIVVVSVAHDHDAAVSSLGTFGARQGDLATLLRQRHSQAPPLGLV